MLWLSHKWVFLRDLDALDNFLLGDDLFIPGMQLKHLVLQFLMRRLVPLQLNYLLLIFQERVQDGRVTPDEVNVGRELGLAFVQQREGLKLGVPKARDVLGQLFAAVVKVLRYVLLTLS